jgi:TolB-like protein
MAGSERFAFGAFMLDLGRRELSRDGAPVPLKNRAFDILCVLASAQGEIVTKDELLGRVWTGIFVEENNLQVHISALRKALDEGHGGTSHVLTVPGRGYRLVGVEPVRERGVSAARPRPGLTAPDKPSIAVLPFVNLSGDPDQEYFADGIAEEIIVGLSRMRWLFVIARNSSFTYKGRNVDVKEVGQQLGVRYVLEGSVRKAANRVRITTQLIDASTGAHVWADRLDGTLDDIFDLQDKVTTSVLAELGPNLERAEIERAQRKPTESLDAYDYYLRGTACAHQGTRDSVTEALRLLGRAIEIDPDFAAPHGLAAFCYLIRQFNGWSTNRERDVAEVKQLAWRAAEVGKGDAVALSFGGLALGYFAGDLENGSALIDRALVLNPNLAFAWYASGLVKSLLGDEPEVAIEQISRAIQLNPLDPFIYTIQTAMALAHFFNGTYDEAASWAAKALRENPRNPGALRCAAASNALAGRPRDAREALTRALELDPDMRVSNLGDRIGGFRRLAAIKYADALRKAGLPD